MNADHVVALANLLSDIEKLAAQPSDAEVLSLVRAMDWRTLADEFEPVVGRYQNAVYKCARHLIRNLRRPYLRYHDHCQLSHWVFMLDGALEDSPSLSDTADDQVALAWKNEVKADAWLARKVRVVEPILTLVQLREAVAEKRRQGVMLEANRNLDYANCGRVPYPEPAKAVGVLPAYACASCGSKHGAGKTPDANAWQHGVCGFCGIETLVSEFRNFRGQAADMLGSDAEYRAALREASAFFENEPEPGTLEGERFEALLAAIEAYESKYLVDPKES